MYDPKFHLTRGRRRWAVALTVLSCIGAPAVHARGATAAELRLFADLEEGWARALCAADAAALDRYEARDYELVNPIGAILDRKQADAEVLSGRQRFESLQISLVRVRVEGRLALVTGRATTRESYQGRDGSGVYTFTDVFRLEGGTWRALHAQLTHLLAPAP